jgi:hypothetical protein
MMATPIRSGSGWIDALFDLCVDILMWLAALFGVSYNEINIWIFCVIWPILTLILIGLVVWQWIRIRTLKRALNRKEDCEHQPGPHAH